MANPGVFEPPAKEPFAAGSGFDRRAFYPPSHTIQGTQENRNYLHNFYTSDSKVARSISSDIDGALAEKAIFDKNTAAYKQQLDQYFKTVDGLPIPDHAGRVNPQTALGLKEPTRSGYGAWLTSKGGTKDEIITNLFKENERARFLFNRLMNEGVMDIVKEDPNAPRDQEYFVRTLINKGKLNEEEGQFYLSGNNRYARIFETDINSRIWAEAKTAGLVEDEFPTAWAERLQSGKPLNPESKADFELYKFAKRTARSPGFLEYANNAGIAFNHLFERVIDTLPASLDSLIHPDYTWSDSFKNPAGEDAQLKSEFIYELNRLIEAKKSSIDGKKVDFPSEIKSFKEKHGGLSEPDALKQYLDERDPTSKVAMNEQMKKVTQLWSKLNKKGAFSGADNPFLAGGQNTLGTVLSVADGVLTATAGLSYLVTSTDPNSVITETIGSKWIDGSDELRFALGAVTWEDVELKAQMRYINAVQGLREGISYVQTEGLFSQISGAGSERLREDVAMFGDIWTAKAIVKNFGKLIGFGGVDAMSEAAAGSSREAAIEARMIAKDLVRKKGKLDGPSRLVIDEVKARAKAAGTPIDDYEAIETIIAGKGTWLNPSTGKVESIPKNVIDALKADIKAKSAGIASVRREAAKIFNAGKNLKYSEKTANTMKLIRQRLAEIEPNLWADASDFEIYQRVMMGSLDVPQGMKSAVEINDLMITALKKEVGEVWRKFDAKGLAGFQDIEALEKLLLLAPSRGVSATLSATLTGLQKGLDKISGEVTRFALPSQSDVAAILSAGGDVDKAASMNLTGSATGNWASRWNEARKIWSLSNLAGYGGYFFEYWTDWQKQATLATNQTRSVSGLLRATYSEQLSAELLRLEKVMAGVKTGLNTKEEQAKLMAKIERLSALKQFASLAHGVTEHGLGAGVYQFSNALSSSFMNEGLMWLGDTQMLGTATGYTFGSKGLTLMNRSFMRNFSPTHGINERTVYDLMELQARMIEMDPSQAKTIREMIEILVKRRDDKINAPGSLIMRTNQNILAQKEFATYINVINRLLTGTNSEFHDASVVSGAMALYGSREFAKPELAEKAKDLFLKQAAELGLEGAEAEAHASRMIKNHQASLAAESGVADIDLNIKKLKDRLAELKGEGEKRMTRHQQIMQMIATEAGVLPESLDIDSNGVVVTAKGKDGKKIDITANLSPGVIKKINNFRDTWTGLAKDIQENKQQILDVNTEIALLEQRRQTLVPNISSERSARIGEFLTLENGTIMERREGVILFHTPVDDGFGNMVSKTQILIDKEAFLRPGSDKQKPGIAIALEEIAHALFMSDALNSNRTTFMRQFLGKWELNEFNQWEMKDGPSVAKTPEQAIMFLDKYAQAYAEGLGTEQGPVFLARWELGKEKWKLNKADTRFMTDVFMEVWGKIYQMRQLVANPQAAKTATTPQSYRGRWETSPIVAGNGSWKNFFKLTFGQTTFMDMITQNDRDNLLAYYSRDVGDESKMTHEEIENRKAEIARIEERIAGSAMWADTFGMGGIYDKLMRGTMIDLLRKFGVKFNNNESPDPMKFFSTVELWDETTGKYAPVHPSLQATVDAAHAMTRGIPSQITMNDNFIFDAIHKNEKLDTPEAKQQRLLWAFSTGRKEWLGKDGKFKAPLAQLFAEESKPIETFKNVVVETDANGQIYGLLPFKNKKGNIVLSGTPSKEQSQRLIEWLRTTGEYGATSPFRLNQHHFDIIAKMLDGIGRSDILDAENVKNKTAGYIPVFYMDYGGVTHMTDSGKIVRGHTGLRRFAPFSVVIDKTTLDAEGYTLKKKDKKGYLTNEDLGSVDMLYFWAIDVDAWNDRSKAGWEGRLKGADDVTYQWTNQLMLDWFGNYNTFIEAQEKVLLNFSAGGPYSGNSTRFPPKRTWQVLLPYANGNQRKAMKMADAILRVIGFPDDQLGELMRLEEKEAKKLSAEEKARIEELRGKLTEDPASESARFFARLQAKDPNEFGAGPAFDAKMIFTKFRPDRVLGPVGRVLTKEGEPALIPFTSNAYSWGKANYSTGSAWFNITNTEIRTLGSQFNMGEDRILSGARHGSGYTLWLLERKNPAFHGVTEQRWVAFDPERRRVSGEFKLRTDAENAAMKHSTENPLSNVPEIGNAFETSMSEAGFLPVGTTFEAGRRTEFISKDGVWTVRRNPATKKFDLVDTKSGLTIRTNMSLKGNQQGARTEVLLATIQDAVEKNSVEIAITEEKYRGLTESGIMEWKRVVTKNGEVQKQFAENNPVYWAFKKHLRNTGDAAWANEITQLMIKELGADVVENNPRRTIEWIQDFRSKGYFGSYFDKMVLQPGQKTFKELRAEERDKAERKNNNLPPLRPERPKGPKPKHYTNEEWLAMLQEIDRAQIDFDLWEDGKVQHEQDVAGHRAALERMMKWSDNLLNEYKAFLDREARGPAPVTSNAMEAAHFAEMHAQTISALRKAGVATENITYISDLGDYIVQIAPKDALDLGGKRVTFPSITGAVMNTLTGKPGKYKPNLFYLYSPKGMFVGAYQTFDEANKRSLDEALKNRSLEAARQKVGTPR